MSDITNWPENESGIQQTNPHEDKKLDGQSSRPQDEHTSDETKDHEEMGSSAAYEDTSAGYSVGGSTGNSSDPDTDLGIRSSAKDERK